MRTRRAAVSLLALLLAAACSGDADGPSEVQPSPDVLPGSDGGERLLVLMDDGSVVTARPDGGGITALARSGGVEVEIRHPVWSPDGRSVAWAELVIGDAGVTSNVVVVDASGAGRTEFPVETGTFFLQWDPTSSRIAYLGSYRGSIAIGVAERGDDGAPVATTLGVGQPFFLSWSPRGDRLLIHVGDSTLGTLDLSGELEQLADTKPGIFQAPVWLPDGRMVYASTADERQHLVVREAGHPTDLVDFEGAIEFVVSPDGRRVAYRVSDGSGLGGISVVEIGSARSRVVTDVPTSAFNWSPDGRRLLLMTQGDSEDAANHRWMVWDGGEARAVGPSFIPSPRFLRDYVPFNGQFAQAMTLWSPEGTSFAFAGLIGDRAGIWVQDLDETEPDFVLEGGSVVSWSPAAD